MFLTEASDTSNTEYPELEEFRVFDAGCHSLRGALPQTYLAISPRLPFATVDVVVVLACGQLCGNPRALCRPRAECRRRMHCNDASRHRHLELSRCDVRRVGRAAGRAARQGQRLADGGPFEG